MKTLFLFLVAFLTGVFAFSAQSVPPIEKMLKSELNYPEFAKENHEEGTVLVSFTIDPNGKIRVQQSNSDNDKLRNYVVDKLSSMIIQNDGNPDGEVNMKFIFRLL